MPITCLPPPQFVDRLKVQGPRWLTQGQADRLEAAWQHLASLPFGELPYVELGHLGSHWGHLGVQALFDPIPDVFPVPCPADGQAAMDRYKHIRHLCRQARKAALERDDLALIEHLRQAQLGGGVQEDAATLRAAAQPATLAPTVIAHLLGQLLPEAIEEAYEGAISLNTAEVVPVLLNLAQRQLTPPDLSARLAELILYHTEMNAAAQTQAITALAPYASVLGALAWLDQKETELAPAERAEWIAAYDALASHADSHTQRTVLEAHPNLPRTRAQVRQEALRQHPASSPRPRRRS